jgi:hypothetical protein
LSVPHRFLDVHAVAEKQGGMAGQCRKEWKMGKNKYSVIGKPASNGPEKDGPKHNKKGGHVE